VNCVVVVEENDEEGEEEEDVVVEAKDVNWPDVDVDCCIVDDVVVVEGVKVVVVATIVDDVVVGTGPDESVGSGCKLSIELFIPTEMLPSKYTETLTLSTNTSTFPTPWYVALSTIPNAWNKLSTFQ
jgi:hypothetical protein